MAYLVDGSNLVGCLFPGEVRDPGRRATLVRRLAIFQRRTKSRVIVVFDGGEPPGLPAAADKAKFRILFPAEGESADAVIEAYLDRGSDRSRLVVVTNDRSLRDLAKSRGASEMKCDDFERLLKKALSEDREAREMEKADEKASALEVRLWSEAFGKKR